MEFNDSYKSAMALHLINKLPKNDAHVLEAGVVPNDFILVPINEDELHRDNVLREYVTLVHCSGYGTINGVSSDTEARIIEEGEPYPVDYDKFFESRFKAYKIGSLTKLSLTFIEDKSFDVYAYLTKAFSRRFARKEENLLINGKGKGEPLGLLNSATVGVEDTEISYDSIVKLFFSLDKDYRRNAVFIVNDNVALKIRTLKDTSGFPIFNHNDNTIFGKKVLISPYMADETKPIIFGDLSYLWFVIRQPLAVKVLNELYFKDGFIGYLANERIDAKLINPEAVKLLYIPDKAK